MRLCPGHEPRHVASKVLAVVIVDVEHPHVLVPGEFLHCAQVALSEIEGGGNGKMPKPVWTDGKPGLRPKLADDEIDCGAREASAFAGAVEIDEERTVFRATGLKPRLECGLRLWLPSRFRYYSRLKMLAVIEPMARLILLAIARVSQTSRWLEVTSRPATLLSLTHGTLLGKTSPGYDWMPARLA
jgi:hypothetical protein